MFTIFPVLLENNLAGIEMYPLFADVHVVPSGSTHQSHQVAEMDPSNSVMLFGVVLVIFLIYLLSNIPKPCPKCNRRNVTKEFECNDPDDPDYKFRQYIGELRDAKKIGHFRCNDCGHFWTGTP